MLHSLVDSALYILPDYSFHFSPPNTCFRFLIVLSLRAYKFYIPAGGMYIPAGGTYIPLAGTYVPPAGT